METMCACYYSSLARNMEKTWCCPGHCQEGHDIGHSLLGDGNLRAQNVPNLDKYRNLQICSIQNTKSVVNLVKNLPLGWNLMLLVAERSNHKLVFLNNRA